MLELKFSLQTSLEFLPKRFEPESPDYLLEIGHIVALFVAFGGVILFLIICFLVLRFGFNKCTGPKKTSQITKGYRNITWVLMSKLYDIYMIYYYDIYYYISNISNINILTYLLITHS